MLLREARIDLHALVPGICDRHEVRGERRAKFLDEIRKRVGEIPILALAEAMARHDSRLRKHLLSSGYILAAASHSLVGGRLEPAPA